MGARRHATIGVSIMMIVCLSACAPAATPPPALIPLVVQLNWTHDAQFAGFYAAAQNGYYAREGLAVTFIQGGLHLNPELPLATGRAQFGVDTAGRLLLAQDGGARLRAIATIFRRSPIVLLSLASSHITRPSDLVGKTINASPDTAPTLHAILAHAGIRPGQYHEVNIGPNFKPLYAGSIPVYASFITAGAVTLKRAGHQLNYIFPDDYGVHLYGSVIITTAAYIAAHPRVVQGFLRATLKGWTDAVEGPASVGPLVARYDPHADPSLQIARMTASLPFINTGEDRIGWMKPAIWADMAQSLRARGLLPRPMDVTQVYTLQFLRQVYGKQQ